MYERVVVTGLGMVSPLGLDTPTTWQALVEGVSGVVRIASFDTEKFETQIAAEVKGFEPERYLDKKDAHRMDRFSQFAAVASLEAIRNAQLKIDDNTSSDVGVFVSSGIGGIITLSEQHKVLLEKGPSRVNPFLVPMMIADMASGRVSILLGAKGPSFCPLSACSSGADAIGVAHDMIRQGNIKAAVAGGAEAAICPIGIAAFNAAGALSKRNHEPQRASRPFDADRDGFVMGEGAGVLVLESLGHALARGANILAEMVAFASTSDAYHITQPGPEGDGAYRAMNLALKRAGLQPEEIDYINAHGTSTPMNDKFETMAIKHVFGEEAYKIPINSTKSMTGHLLAAGASLEAGVCVLAVLNGLIPPTINLETPDPDCDLNYTPFVARRGKVRTAMNNSLGFGGHNTTLIFRRFEE